MKLRNFRLERSPKLMIIPMIDIIFFLLVFFMMSTLQMVEQKTMPINLPQAAAAQADVQKPIAVTVTDTGRVSLEQEDVPLALLGQRIQTEIARHPQAVVVLRADRRAEHGNVVAVMDELKVAGVQRIAVATETKTR